MPLSQYLVNANHNGETQVKPLISSSVMTVAMMVLSHSIAAAQDQRVTLSSCIDSGFSELISAQNREFSSQQFYIVCQYRDVKRRTQDKAFTYHPPEGFKIVSADVNVISKTAQTSVGDLTFDEQRATVNLQCQGRQDSVDAHDGIAVKLAGQLEYQPTVGDLKDIAGSCLDQIPLR